MFSLNSVHLEQMRRDGNPRIALIERMLSEPRRLIVTILIGNEFVNVAASVLSASMVIQVFGPDNKLYNLFIMVPILLIVGEITPKTLAIRNSVAFATAESGPINLFARLITPLRWLVRVISDIFTTMIVGQERSRGNIVTEDMVRTLAHDAVGKGALDQVEAGFIDRIFEFGNKRLEDLLTPRTEITFMAADSSVAQITTTLQQTRQSRIPVYGEHRDDIIGILHARDLLSLELSELDDNHDRFIQLLRKPWFVPETKPALELFDSFRQQQRSFALTVDEYGGITGLITMEDLLECIFGHIPSPSDQLEDFRLREVSKNCFALDGMIPLNEFNQQLGTDLVLDGNEDIATIGGLVLHAFGELPQNGETVDLQGLRFTAFAVEHNRLVELHVERLEILDAFDAGIVEASETASSEPATGEKA